MAKKQSISEGTMAPSFALREHHGKVVRLREFLGRKIVLYFYVRDDTPECTKEACSFRDQIRRLRSMDVVVLGVSHDSAACVVRRICMAEHIMGSYDQHS